MRPLLWLFFSCLYYLTWKGNPRRSTREGKYVNTVWWKHVVKSGLVVFHVSWESQSSDEQNMIIQTILNLHICSCLTTQSHWNTSWDSWEMLSFLFHHFTTVSLRKILQDCQFLTTTLSFWIKQFKAYQWQLQHCNTWSVIMIWNSSFYIT